MRLYQRLALQGPRFFQTRRTGDLMALATNDVDAVEMAAGEAMLAGFDGTLTLVLVVAMMTLGVDWRLALVVLLPFPLMALALLVDLAPRARGLAPGAGRLRRAQRPCAGKPGRRAHAARAGAGGAQQPALRRAGRGRRRRQLRRPALGGSLRAGRGLHAERGRWCWRWASAAGWCGTAR